MARKKYDRCRICGAPLDTEAAHVYGFCSSKCHRLMVERNDMLLKEKKDYVLARLDEMCPMGYHEACNRLAKELGISRRLFGRLFLPQIKLYFRFYPNSERSHNFFSAVLYRKPSDYEKAVEISQKLFESLPVGEQNFLRGRIFARKAVSKRIRSDVLRMYNVNLMSVDQILEKLKEQGVDFGKVDAVMLVKDIVRKG